MEMKTLAFVIPSLQPGGAERVLSTVANRLSKQYKIIIYVLYQCEIHYELEKGIEIIFCKDSYTSKSNLIKSISNHFYITNFISQSLKKNKIDLVIGFTTTANIYSIVAARRLKIPAVVSERIYPKYNSNKIWDQLRVYFYPKADAIVVQTQMIKDYFLRFTSQSKVYIIKNPIAPDLLKRKNSSIDKENIILNVGRLDYQKNQAMLIRAFGNLESNDWKLVIVGDGVERENLNRLIAELSLLDKVEILGNIQDVSTYLNKAKIFALPSRYEGFPNVLIEAMFFELACVSTDCPSGPSEIIDNGKSGILVPVDDISAMTTALKKLINNAELRKLLALNALEKTKQYDDNLITSQWLDLIENLIN